MNNIFERDTLDLLSIIWHFELFSVKGHPVYFSQTIIAVIIFVVGLFVIRWIAKRLMIYLQGNTDLDKNSTIFIQRIVYYLLLIVLILATLQMLNFPITMFAFLGGAIIIGIGFGAQNIFNNFFSGIILMIERPVRIGDIIEVDVNTGRIEDIGARCARMRRFDGVEVLIPNSKLLENIVVNRTLTDSRIRSNVTVGVAYGSPVKQVIESIGRITAEQSGVLPEPPPAVFFQEFGDSALLFEVFFWIEMNELTDLRKIRSDIRYLIDAEFARQGIVIAFPQQDTHLDSLAPIEVKLVNGEG